MNPKAKQFGAEEVDLRDVSFTEALLACVPAGLAGRFRVVPVSDSPKMLRFAIADPSDLAAIDSLRKLLQRDLELVVAEASQLDEFIPRLYQVEGKA